MRRSKPDACAPMDDVKRFPKNAPGPFWVENDMCMSCGAPEHEAPELMAFDEEANHCYFKRQPITPEETERAVRAVWASCCSAVRYSGDDPLILKRLRELETDRIMRIPVAGRWTRATRDLCRRIWRQFTG